LDREPGQKTGSTSNERLSLAEVRAYLDGSDLGSGILLMEQVRNDPTSLLSIASPRESSLFYWFFWDDDFQGELDRLAVAPVPKRLVRWLAQAVAALAYSGEVCITAMHEWLSLALHLTIRILSAGGQTARYAPLA
jgi:hypothetical protein